MTNAAPDPGAQRSTVLCVLSDEGRSRLEQKLHGLAHPGLLVVHEPSPRDALSRVAELGVALALVGNTDEMESLELLATMLKHHGDLTAKIIVLPDEGDPFPPMMHWREATGGSQTREIAFDELDALLAELAGGSTPSPQPLPGPTVPADALAEGAPARPAPVPPRRLAAPRPPGANTEGSRAKTKANERALPPLAGPGSYRLQAPESPGPNLGKVGLDRPGPTLPRALIGLPAPAAAPVVREVPTTPQGPEIPTVPAPPNPALVADSKSSAANREGAGGSGPQQGAALTILEILGSGSTQSSSSSVAEPPPLTPSDEVQGVAPEQGAAGAPLFPAGVSSTPTEGYWEQSPGGMPNAPPPQASPRRMEGLRRPSAFVIGPILVLCAALGLWIAFGSAARHPAEPSPSGLGPRASVAAPHVPESPVPAPSSPGPTGAGTAGEGQDNTQVLHYSTVLPLAFDRGSDEYRITDLQKLEAMVEAARRQLQRHPRTKAEIGGHASNEGHADVNIVVSHRRALRVQRYLISRGILLRQTQIRSYGASAPLGEGEEANRRVTLRLVE